MIIIGLSGIAGSGKTTIANHIAVRSPGVAYVVNFADPLRDVAQAVFGSRYASQEDKAAVDLYWDHRIYHPKDRRSEGPENMLGDEQVTGRRILQFVGTDMFRNLVHPNVWLYAMDRRLSALDNAKVIIVGDVRFANEAQFIRRRGGVVVKLSRIGQPEAVAGSHASEKPLPAELIDHDIAVADGLAGAAAEMIYSLAVRHAG
jgi:hypothetical protein